jgi:predicted O-linked N-acetylglucosamine transferase (SPINDLY family)
MEARLAKGGSKDHWSRGQGPRDRHIPDANSTADGLLRRALSYHQAGNLTEAEGLYRQILQISPFHFDALHLLGVMACQVGKNEIAMELIDRAIHVYPRSAEAYSNRANALYELQRYQEAVDSCDRAIALKPDYADAFSNRGNALNALHRYTDGLDSCDQALRLRHDYAEAHNNRGNALHALRRYEESLADYQAAIRINPQFAEAHGNYGAALFELQQYREAIDQLDQAIRLKPSSEYSSGLRLLARRFLCDWDGIDAECKELEAQVRRGERAAYPLVCLAISDSPALQSRVAETFTRDKVLPQIKPAAMPRRARRDKIRVGYFSPDFHNHAISYLIAGLFERHDRSRFEVLGFSLGPLVRDEMRERIASSMDQLMDVDHLSDHEVAELSRHHEVDIAVDLAGFTKGSRPAIFASHAAPIQVSFLGYPGTMGADFIDYVIADPIVINSENRPYFTEKIAFLPDCYQVNDSNRAIASATPTRQEERLPDVGFVYCCFNNGFKITPEIFDTWMRILAHVPGSVLWLLEGNPEADRNLRKEAARRGIAEDRIIFASRLPVPDHLARHKLADLFLDTLPYNAHTTASDSLWAGVPVLTREGKTFASRVAASLLWAVGLQDMVTKSEEAYEDLAVQLGLNAEKIGDVRRRLEENRLSLPLFDTDRFARNLEAAYNAMYARYHESLLPCDLYIGPH